MRILFVGESWLGSCARSLREALARQDDVVLEELNEDLWFSRSRGLVLRVAARLTSSMRRREFSRELLARAAAFRPDVVVAYKGNAVSRETIQTLTSRGVLVANVYPDCSPHAHGEAHRDAVGAYDLVISTKSYHPRLWSSVYGYSNACEFVPQGYDPALHEHAAPPSSYDYDIALVATWRAEYGNLVSQLARALGNSGLRVAIGGHGWRQRASEYPAGWRFLGGVTGTAYVELLRAARLCIAPLTREVSLGGRLQPGDVDTTRTYELAAAHCFFIHRRTDYVRSLYDEETEVPMFDDAGELAHHIRYFLAHDQRRVAMARAAHRRAVPAYSLDSRSRDIVSLLRRYRAS